MRDRLVSQPAGSELVVTEGQAMVKASAARPELVFLTGMQHRSAPHIAEAAEIVRGTFLDQGWVVLDTASPAFGQAQASATEFLVEEDRPQALVLHLLLQRSHMGFDLRVRRAHRIWEHVVQRLDLLLVAHGEQRHEPLAGRGVHLGLGQFQRRRIQGGRIIDGTGKTRVPGLWDAHKHFGNGNDLLDGDRDSISTATGNDVLIGGPGDDTLISGPGMDTLTPGEGADLIQDLDSDDTVL